MSAVEPTPQLLPPMGQHTLPRTLGVRQVALLSVGSVIGSGIYIVPAEVLRQAGSLNLALLIWGFAGLLSLVGALTYAELAASKPEAGGLYVYLRDAFGPLVAFLFGWTIFAVIATGAVAALTVASVPYLRQLIPLPESAARWVPLLVIAALAAVNVRGTRQSAGLQGWATMVKAGAIVLLAGLLVLLGKGLAPSYATPGIAYPSVSWTGLGLATIGTLWSYEGWQFVTFSAGETREPQKVFPRGLLIGMAVLAGIYLLANVGYVAALGYAGAAASQSVAADAVSAVLGRGAGRLIAAVVVVSTWSAAHSILLTSPRVLFAMSRDGVFFARLGQVHPRFGTPAAAVLACSVWAAVLAATGTFGQLLTYVVFTGWIFYALAAASVFVYRRRSPAGPRPFEVPGYPWTPLLFVLAAAALVGNAVLARPREALVGLGGVLLGVPIFWLWRRRTR